MSTTIPLEPGYFYHIYNHSNGGEVLFRETKNYQYFLKLYDRHISSVADTYAWCLMGNHFHLLIQPKTEADQAFANLFNAYSKAFNKLYNRRGSLFIRPFKRKWIDDENYLCQVVSYIHLNPVLHGFVGEPNAYFWSSYGTMISEFPTRLKRKEVLGWFGSLEGFIAYHQETLDWKKLEGYLKMKKKWT